MEQDKIDKLTQAVEALARSKGNDIARDPGVGGMYKTFIGPEGKEGAKGEQGDKGDKGDVGEEGLMGPRGRVGEKGEKGDVGEKGDTGPVGPKGRDGLSGRDADGNTISKYIDLGGFEEGRLSYNYLRNSPDIKKIAKDAAKEEMINIPYNGIKFLRDMSDVDMSSISNGQTLAWDNTLAQFKPAAGGVAQTQIQMQEEGINLGTTGTVDTINFTGSTITASRIGNTMTVNVNNPQALNYLGSWNANTNTPAVVSGVGTNGDFYIVSVAGTTNIDGVNEWAIGDWLLFENATNQWKKMDNSEGNPQILNWATGVVYRIDDVVIAENRIYRSINNHTAAATFDIDRVNWNVVKELAIANFVATTYYYAAEQITDNDRILRRLANGVSGAVLDATERATWSIVNLTQLADFVGLKYYYANEEVFENGRVLSRIASGTSLATIDLDRANWTLKTKITADNWAANTYYYANEDVFQDGNIYTRLTDGVSGGTWNATEILNWSARIQGSDIGTWTASTFYEANELVRQGTRILQRNTTGTSGLLFDVAEASNWAIIKKIDELAWAPNTYYFLNELVQFDTTLYRRNTAGLSGATLDLTERGFWSNLVDTTPNIKNWTTATVYPINSLVYNEQRIYRANLGHTSGVFNTDRANWDVIKQRDFGVWVASTYYYADELSELNGVVGKRSTSGTSGATLNAGELTNWRVYPANRYYAVTNLIAGGNLINHLLGLTNPEGAMVQVVDATGATVSFGRGTYTANAVTITLAAPLTGALVTVI